MILPEVIDLARRVRFPGPDACTRIDCNNGAEMGAWFRGSRSLCVQLIYTEPRNNLVAYGADVLGVARCVSCAEWS